MPCRCGRNCRRRSGWRLPRDCPHLPFGHLPPHSGGRGSQAATDRPALREPLPPLAGEVPAQRGMGATPPHWHNHRMTAPFVVAIPARYAASRLPGKPLRLLGGEPLVLHVARRALAAGAREVWVAADDARIADALADSGVRIAMTSPDHASGSDRLAECAAIAGWADDAVVVN